MVGPPLVPRDQFKALGTPPIKGHGRVLACPGHPAVPELLRRLAIRVPPPSSPSARTRCRPTTLDPPLGSPGAATRAAHCPGRASLVAEAELPRSRSAATPPRRHHPCPVSGRETSPGEHLVAAAHFPADHGHRTAGIQQGRRRAPP
jgi:hypothetical protein